MRASRNLEILAITALFVNYLTGDAKCQTTTETLIKISTSVSKPNISIPSLKAATSFSKNLSMGMTPIDYWMSRMGSMQSDLINIQAIVVKDEEIKGTCDPAERKSNKRYLMCAGSILNRNHVLTSATCLHEATHIRHNIRAPLSVVIAPLKTSIQVIGVTEYQIHPRHYTNPYSKQHLKHNLAILKLACRISMDNFHKIELPHSPMTQTCSDENCVVAVYRKTGRTSNVMFQILSPNMPYPNRRRKETSAKDVEFQRFKEYEKAEMDDVIRVERPKRKLAEPPTFIGKHRSEKRFNVVSSSSTSEPIIESSRIVEESTTRISPEDKNLSSTAESSLYEAVSKALKRSGSGNEKVKSFVVRSSQMSRSCALTGAPVMLNRTQAALVAIPCDDRQPSSRWQYSDLFDSLDWIHDTLHEWNPMPHWPIGSEGIAHPATGTSTNYSGCSTCIFNFFIEIGCKDKNQCGKNFTGIQGHHVPVQESSKPENTVSDGRRKSPGCTGRNSIGLEVGVGQGCEKTIKESGNRSEYRGKSSKSMNAQINGVEKKKQLSLGNGAVDDAAQPVQPVTIGPVKTPIRDYIVDKDKYSSKDNSRVSGISRIYKTPVRVNSRREKVTNEIGLQNIEGETADWISEVEKGLELSPEVKRESVKSRGSNIIIK